METTFEIPSTDKHPFVAPLKSHGSFSLRARLSDVGKTQLPICRGCAVFANAKQRLKMRPHKLEDGLTDLLSGTSTDGFSFFFFSFRVVFVSATGRLIMKPLSLLENSTLMFSGLEGNRESIVNFTWDNMPRRMLMARQ